MIATLYVFVFPQFDWAQKGTNFGRVAFLAAQAAPHDDVAHSFPPFAVWGCPTDLGDGPSLWIQSNIIAAPSMMRHAVVRPWRHFVAFLAFAATRHEMWLTFFPCLLSEAALPTPEMVPLSGFRPILSWRQARGVMPRVDHGGTFSHFGQPRCHYALFFF